MALILPIPSTTYLGEKMGFFDFLKKKKKQKVFNVDKGEFEDAKLINFIIKMESSLLEYIPPENLKIIHPDTKDQINHKLAGYIVGLYNAHTKYFGKPFNTEVLELAVSSLYGDDAGEAFVKELMVASACSQSETYKTSLFAKTFDTYESSQKIGWSEYINWRTEKSKCTNGLYKIFVEKIL